MTDKKEFEELKNKVDKLFKDMSPDAWDTMAEVLWEIVDILEKLEERIWTVERKLERVI